MGFQHIKNIVIRGIAACVPKHIEDNRELLIFGNRDQALKFVETTGVITRHTINKQNICSSDMCFQAADKLLNDLKWRREDIDCLLFVSQTPDYIMPATACILQDRLGLSNECFAMDISLGCSGWIHGMATIGALMQNGSFEKGLLLAGDTSTVTKSPNDKSAYPLFGDSGTATALEYIEDAEGIKFHTSTDGKGYQSIIIPDGGFRNFYNFNSDKEIEFEDGIKRSKLHTFMDGAAVFTFGISKAPKSILGLLSHFNIDIDKVDYFVLHQANKLLNEKIRTKLKIPEGKTPYSIDEYGNTSSSSIPLTMVTRLKKELVSTRCSVIACGFGVGLSWGTIYTQIEKIVCPEIILI